MQKLTSNLAKSGKRYTCFTPEQQATFDHLQEKAKRYLLFRAQGFSKRGAYAAAGYKDNQNASKGARVLESRIPDCEELLQALCGHNERMEVYQEESKTSQQIDEIAKTDFEMPPIVPAEVEGVQDKIDLQNISGETARRIQFYRQIANGVVKSIKTTKTYDKDGNLTGKKVEEFSDVSVRMKARAELDRALGLNDMLQIGQVSAGSITINIVDTSKKDELADPRNNIIIGDGTVDGGDDE